MVTSPLHLPFVGPKLRPRAQHTHRLLLAVVGLTAAVTLGTVGDHLVLASHPLAPTTPAIVLTGHWPLLIGARVSTVEPKHGSLGQIGLQQPSTP